MNCLFCLSSEVLMIGHLTLALKRLPIGGIGGVDEPGGSGLVSGKISVGRDGQVLIAAFGNIPVLTEITALW